MPEEIMDAAVDSSTTTEGQGQGSQDAAVSGENVPWNKDPRFREFLAAKKEFDEYKRLGDLDSLRTVAEKAKVLDKLIEEAQTQDPQPQQDNRVSEAQRIEAQQWLVGLFPFLAEVPKQLARLDTLVGSIEGAARDAAEELLEEHGLPTGKKDVQQMEEQLAGIIMADPKLANRFYRDPEGVVKVAFKQMTKKFEDAAKVKAEADKQKKGEPLSKLPATHPASGGSGGVGKEGQGPPKTLKEATKIAMARLEAAG